MLLPRNFNLLVKIFLWVILQKALHANAEFYTSIHEMSKLVRYEEQFVKYMQKFIADNESKLDFLKARLAEFEREGAEALAEGIDYFDSPVNKYLLTKRLTVDWERIENLMAYRTGEKVLQRMDQYERNRTFPNANELTGAIEGFIRLQDIYRLKTKDMAAGILQGVSYATQLEARHCFDVGKQAITTTNKLRLGHSWLVEALERLDAKTKGRLNNFELVEEPLKRADIMLVLADVKFKLGDRKGANATYTELLQLQPDSEQVAKAYAEFMHDAANKEMVAIDLRDEHEPMPEDLSKTSQSDRYKYTCGGHIQQTPSEERELRCGYLTETHPFLLLAPLKVEELNHDPLLVVYHNVISNSEIDTVRSLANSHITRAMVMGVNGSIVSPVRTSQYTFIPRTMHKVLQTIDERVQDMTNMNLNYYEDHQFSNYGIGGHYSEHFDWFVCPREQFAEQVASPEMGNRIGTVLFYLTDVEQGGGTAFPYLKRLLLPKKGDAAFWFNLHLSGDGDERTLHGGCPIIVGSKWVQNRWIREYFQDDRRPCCLHPDKVYGPF